MFAMYYGAVCTAPISAVVQKRLCTRFYTAASRITTAIFDFFPDNFLADGNFVSSFHGRKMKSIALETGDETTTY